MRMLKSGVLAQIQYCCNGDKGFQTFSCLLSLHTETRMEISVLVEI